MKETTNPTTGQVVGPEIDAESTKSTTNIITQTHNNINITILTPTWEESRSSKLVKRNGDDTVEVIEGHKLGKYFKLRKIAKVNGLAELHCLFKQLDSQKVIRVYGSPIDSIITKPNTEIRRIKENFPAPEEGTYLLEIDADKWRLPETPINLRDKSALRGYLESYFKEYQLDYLARREVLVCFSSSSAINDDGVLIGAFSAHLYMLLDAPMQLEKLRAWAHAVNGRIGKQIIDGSVYRSVQPDFFQAPEFIDGAADPFGPHRRVLLGGEDNV
jgi:hypothetical protein